MTKELPAYRLFSRCRAWVVFAVCGASLLLGTAFYFSNRSPVQRLQPYLGRDLRTLPDGDQAKFDALVGQLAPEARRFFVPDHPQTWDPGDWQAYLASKPHTPWGFPRSWYLWRVADGQGQQRLVLFQGRPLVMIPDASSAHVFVFDADGHLLTKSHFLTGYRISMDDASWLTDSGHGFPCLLVRSTASINGLDVACQYYALLQDSFALVRLEDSAGALVQVDYHSPDHTIGPPVPQRTPEEWEAVLRSSDRAEVLRTLLWLGGSHSDPPLEDMGLSVEPFEDATRALVTRRRAGVCSAVESLTRSEDGWMREAAQHTREALKDAGR
jgi:hypothetical protein